MTSLNIIHPLPLLHVCWFSWCIPTFISFSLLVHSSCKLLHCPSVVDYGGAGMLSKTTAKKKERESSQRKTKLSTHFKLIYNINKIQTYSNKFTKNKHQAHGHRNTHNHILLCVYTVYAVYTHTQIHTGIGQFRKCHQVCRKRGK